MAIGTRALRRALFLATKYDHKQLLQKFETNENLMQEYQFFLDEE
jgi:hypothetical protein